MRFDANTTTIGTAGTAVQISNTADRVKSISVKARAANAGNTYFGISDVDKDTGGWEMLPGEEYATDFGEGSVLFSVFYVDAAQSGDKVDWKVILA